MSSSRVAVVIPAYRENDWIFRSLDSLAASFRACVTPKDHFNVVVVVNNPVGALEEDRSENWTLLNSLHDYPTPFPLTLIERVDPGLENGVGEARKIGMDYAVSSFLKSPHDLIVSLDADTSVSTNYVETLFSRKLSGAGFTLRVEHLLSSGASPEGIRLYETFLAYMCNGLKRAGSPFAFDTIGSALGTDVGHYITSGGMPAKNSTEDFHFLNKLRKLGPIEEWHDAKVYPAARKSNRVHLGTGYFLTAYEEDPGEAFRSLRIPLPEAFDRLREFLSATDHFYEIGEEAFRTAGLDSSKEAIIPKLESIRRGTTSKKAYQKRVLEVIDGLFTWRFLRDVEEIEKFPNIEAFREVSRILARSQ